MDVYFLNKNLQTYAILDVYQSMIWTERYDEPGDFELYAPVTPELIEICTTGNYVSIGITNRLMVIEKVEIQSVFDDVDHIVVSGRSLESLLDRRIVWNMLTYNGSLQALVQRLLNDAFINPSNSARKVSNFRFSSSSDSTITSLTVEAQYLGQSILDVVTELCTDKNLGFKVEFQNGNFVFSLYRGLDRSYEQTANPYVIFSTNYENLKSTSYVSDDSKKRTVCLVGGEGEGNAKKFADLDRGDTGLERREIYKEASGVSSKTDSQTTISDAEYKELLKYEAMGALLENMEEISFSGEYSEGTNFIYKRDFNLGDIVEITDPYGHTDRVRIKEWIISLEDGTYSQYPTFESVGGEE